MSDPTPLKLVTLYDAGRNEYTLFGHNLSAEEAAGIVREVAARFFGLFIIDQQARHAKGDPDECATCRGDVERSSRIQPKPTLKRRHV